MKIDEMDKMETIFRFVQYGHFEDLEWSKCPEVVLLACT